MHNMTFELKYFVHFSVWTKCLSDGYQEC